MKKIIAIALVVMMALTFLPMIDKGPDVVSAATGGGGGGGGGGGTTGTAPKAPTALALPAGYTAGETTMKLTWKDNATNEEGFKVERVMKGGSAWTQVASVGKDITIYSDTGLQPGTTYFYRIKAWNNYGVSVASNELIVTTAKAGASTPVITYSNTPSSWATAEIEKAKEAGLTVESLLSSYNKPITRAEFSELVVKLHEKAIGKAIIPVTPNPFTDTQSEAVLKAYAAGIINGVSADKFAPNANVTRQEMAVMLQRELQASDAKGQYVVGEDFTTIFADEAAIASWAIDAVRFMNQSGIINGVGEGKIDPKGNATREQAMLMVYRDYEKFAL